MRKLSLVEQLRRINTLMDIKKIIKEGSIISKAATALEDILINKVTREIDAVSGVEEFSIGKVKMSPKVYNTLMTVAQDISLFPALNKSEQILFGKLCREIPNFTNDTYKQVVDKLINDGLIKSEEEFINDIYTKVLESQGALTELDILSQILKGDDGVSDLATASLISKKVATKVEEFKSTGKLKPEIPAEQIPNPNIERLTTEVPIEMNSKEKVMAFQDWLDINHPNWIENSDGTTKNLNKGKGYGEFGQNTQRAWLDYQTEYLEGLKIGEKLKNVNYRELTAEEFNYLERFFSSKYTVFNEIRKSIGQLIFDFLAKKQTQDEIIEEVFSKLKTVVQDASKSLRTGEKVDLTAFRNINMTLRTLQDEKVSIKTLTDEIEKVLSQQLPPSEKAVLPEVMKILRETDPWKEGQKTWASLFIDNLTWTKILKGVFDKNLSAKQRLFNFIERGTVFGFTGTAKKIAEITSYRAKYGKKWLWELTKDLWYAKWIGLPLFFSVWESIKYLVASLFSEQEYNETFSEKIKKIFEEEFTSVFKSRDGEFSLESIGYGLLPIHYYWSTWYNYILDSLNKVSQQKVKLTDDIEKDLQKAQEQIDSTYSAWMQKAEIEKQKQQAALDSLKSSTESKIDSLTGVLEDSGLITNVTLTVESLKQKYPCYWNPGFIDTNRGKDGIDIINDNEFVIYLVKDKRYNVTKKENGEWVFEDGTLFGC